MEGDTSHSEIHDNFKKIHEIRDAFRKDIEECHHGLNGILEYLEQRIEKLNELCEEENFWDLYGQECRGMIKELGDIKQKIEKIKPQYY